VCWDVAGDARVGVVAPGAAHGRGSFNDDVRVLALGAQTQRGTQPGEAGAHDRDPDPHRPRAGLLALIGSCSLVDVPICRGAQS
jgi:hypothetical protein